MSGRGTTEPGRSTNEGVGSLTGGRGRDPEASPSWDCGCARQMRDPSPTRTTRRAGDLQGLDERENRRVVDAHEVVLHSNTRDGDLAVSANDLAGHLKPEGHDLVMTGFQMERVERRPPSPPRISQRLQAGHVVTRFPPGWKSDPVDSDTEPAAVGDVHDDAGVESARGDQPHGGRCRGRGRRSLRRQRTVQEPNRGVPQGAGRKRAVCPNGVRAETPSEPDRHEQDPKKYPEPFRPTNLSRPGNLKGGPNGRIGLSDHGKKSSSPPSLPRLNCRNDHPSLVGVSAGTSKPPVMRPSTAPSRTLPWNAQSSGPTHVDKRVTRPQSLSSQRLPGPPIGGVPG